MKYSNYITFLPKYLLIKKLEPLARGNPLLLGCSVSNCIPFAFSEVIIMCAIFSRIKKNNILVYS